MVETAGSHNDEISCVAVKEAAKFKQQVMNAKKQVESGNSIHSNDGSGGNRGPQIIQKHISPPASEETVRLLGEIKEILLEQNRLLATHSK